MSVLNDRSVWANGDGTYTITPDVPGDGNWTLRDTGTGWEAAHPVDGFEGLRFATAEDAAQAVLGDPADTVLYGGRRYSEVVR